MKLVTAISTTVLTLTLGLAASAYAQEQHDQKDQKEEEKAKPAQQDEKKASPHKPSKAEKKDAEKQKSNAGQEENATQQHNKDAKPEETNARQQPQHTEHAQQPEQHANGGGDHGGGRIPEDRYRAHFGQEHRFHVNQADYGRDRRFQYGGYTFGFVDVWPSNWLYTQDVFVIEIDGVYYLCNPTYPGVNVALTVVL